MQQQILMARQPIYDDKINIVAYELLFRQVGDDTANFVDGDAASSEILVNAFTQWDISEIVGDTRAFVIFKKNLINKEIPFDKKRLVIEVLEDVPIDESLVKELKALSENGYTIALDDFVHSPKADDILPFADIVKIDVLSLSHEEVEDHVKLLSRYRAKLLAEKVETHEDFERCKQLGFHYFQGFFLCKPEIISNTKVPANKLAVLQLMHRLQNPEIETRELETIVGGDPVLSFKVLKLVNSASYARVAKIESIGQAINMLGQDRLRSLTTLLALSSLSDKPSGLREFSCIRARLCELIGNKLSPKDASGFFSVGLLSMLEAYFDKRMEDILPLLTLHEDIETALMEGTGVYGKVLEIVKSYQQGEFELLDWPFLKANQISPECLTEMNHQSIVWYQSLSEL
jgi:EAL and modified HD-GYP domain-containing signal transduction protein